MTINVAKLPSDISRPLRSPLIMRRGSYNDLRISFLIPIRGRRASVRSVRLQPAAASGSSRNRVPFSRYVSIGTANGRNG